MSVGTQIGVAAGNVTGQFDVVNDFGLGADGDLYVVNATGAAGLFLAWQSAGVARPVVANEPATVWYLGIQGIDVVSATAYPFELQFDYRAIVSAGKVPIWRFGRFLLPVSSGSVSAGAPLYPAAGGLLSVTQTGSAPIAAMCRVGNTSSGGPIEIELGLWGHRGA